MVVGHRGHHGLHVNKSQVKNVNVVQEHVHNQYQDSMDEHVKDRILKLLNVKVKSDDY